MDGRTKKPGGVLTALLNRRVSGGGANGGVHREPELPRGWPEKLPFRKRPKPYSRAISWTPVADDHPRGNRAAQKPDKRRPYELFVSQSVLREVRGHLISARTGEPFGFLIGQVVYCPWTETPYIVIDAVRRETQDLPPSSELDRFRHAWIGATRDARHRRAQVIGWYHQHGVLGLRLSEWDLKLQDEFFPEPWQCALIIAVGDGPMGGFIQRSHRARLFRKGLAPFQELIELDSQLVNGRRSSVVDWVNYRPGEAVSVIGAAWPDAAKIAERRRGSSHATEETPQVADPMSGRDWRAAARGRAGAARPSSTSKQESAAAEPPAATAGGKSTSKAKGKKRGKTRRSGAAKKKSADVIEFPVPDEVAAKETEDPETEAPEGDAPSEERAGPLAAPDPETAAADLDAEAFVAEVEALERARAAARPETADDTPRFRLEPADPIDEAPLSPAAARFELDFLEEVLDPPDAPHEARPSLEAVEAEATRSEEWLLSLLGEVLAAGRAQERGEDEARPADEDESSAAVPASGGEGGADGATATPESRKGAGRESEVSETASPATPARPRPAGLPRRPARTAPPLAGRGGKVGAADADEPLPVILVDDEAWRPSPRLIAAAAAIALLVAGGLGARVLFGGGDEAREVSSTPRVSQPIVPPEFQRLAAQFRAELQDYRARIVEFEQGQAACDLVAADFQIVRERHAALAVFAARDPRVAAPFRSADADFRGAQSRFEATACPIGTPPALNGSVASPEGVQGRAPETSVPATDLPTPSR